MQNEFSIQLPTGAFEQVLTCFAVVVFVFDGDGEWGFELFGGLNSSVLVVRRRRIKGASAADAARKFRFKEVEM